MTTILGKSGVRTLTVGKVPRRETAGDGKDREIEIIRDGSKIYLHIHSPGKLDNGWAITVSEQDLVSALSQN